MESLEEFLHQYKTIKGEGKRFTHTRIGSKKNESPTIYPGSYAIPKDKMSEFYKLYHKKVFIQNRQEYLTERQSQKGGPVLVDLDFRYGTQIDTRQHDANHITDLIDLYLSELLDLMDITDGAEIPIYVLEKDEINVNNDDFNIIKDGIHIIIGISMDHTQQQILRKHIMTDTEGSDSKIDYILDDLPLTNSYDEVLDCGITKGHTNWQLYGSQKPGFERYKLTRFIICQWDKTDDNWQWEEQNIEEIPSIDLLKTISAQYQQHPKFPINNKYKDQYEKLKINKSSKTRKTKKIPKEDIHDFNMLQKACDAYLGDLNDEVDYNIKETHQFAMALPKEFYNQFDKWIRVGWALYNTDKRMFNTWMLFSSQSDKFNFEDIPKYYDDWKKMKKGKEHGLTQRSIMYWVKESNPPEYEKIKKKTVEFYMEKVLDSPTEVDIAEVLNCLYKDRYACVSVEKRCWYEFSQNRWQREDSGNSLRHNISKILSPKYKSLSTRYVETVHKLQKDPEHEELVNTISQKIKKCSNICLILKKTTHKNNIMREAAEIFYDKQFFDKLDQNPYLLACENGVVDFKAEGGGTVFRKGKPEDYLSLNTQVNYLPLEKCDPEIIKEINNFMHQLFPIPELYKYMWDHLGSTMLGTNQNQTFNIYTGEGRNGKSKLVDLMSMILGDYKGTVPISLITQKRGSIGGVSPEIAQLMGKRYAVMQEPSKGDKINEGIMKEITGGDPITGRLLFKDSITFVPQFKLCVCTNNLFDINSNDNGTWRRIRVCPYMSLFTEIPFDEVSKNENPHQFIVDKKIDKEKFPRWKVTFLAMLVDIVTKTGGDVKDCPIVMAASNEYRDDQNSLAQFANEILELDSEGVLKWSGIWETMKKWWQENGKGPKPKTKDLKKFLDRKYGKRKRDTLWHGVRIKDFDNLD
jgi:P4 family phage/plasmid primase-like protien